MESAIGGLFFLLAVGAIGALCFKHRAAIEEWLNTPTVKPSDSHLAELTAKVTAAKKEQCKYERRLHLQKLITDANRELADMGQPPEPEGK